MRQVSSESLGFKFGVLGCGLLFRAVRVYKGADFQLGLRASGGIFYFTH